ncbi:MAG: MFS transporter [Limibacillus sp.]|jgi:MFS family permease
MLSVIRPVATLMLGVLLLLVGHSLMGVAVPLRLEAAGFSTLTNGLVASSYFAGLLAGAYYGQRIIVKVGHIRSFAGFAAVMTATVLALPLLFHPVAWVLLRFATGVCLAGLFSTAESWLNERSENRTRGQMMAFYTTVSYLAMIGGQQLINIYPLDGLEVFLVAGVLTTLCVAPTALTRVAAPNLEAVQPMSVVELYRASPLSVIGSASSGLMQGGIWGLAAVYARRVGFDTLEVSLFIGAVTLGGLLLQWPIGRYSDRYDRRSILVIVLILVVIACSAGVGLAFLGDYLPPTTVLLVAAMMGGGTAAIYPLSVAQAFDYLPREKYVAGSSALLLSYSAGATVGPILTALLMDFIGDETYFGNVAVLALLLALFVRHRMKVREALPVVEQGAMVATPPLAPVVPELDPRVDPVERDEAPAAMPPDSGQQNGEAGVEARGQGPS